MKKLGLFILLLLCLNSCLPDDSDYEKYHLELIPVEEVEIPYQFIEGHTYTIKLNYRKKSTCHFPNGIYFSHEDYTRIIAVQNIVYERSDCSIEVPEPIVNQEVAFGFKVTQQAGTSYIFKFYNGGDISANTSFLLIEVPVVASEDINP